MLLEKIKVDQLNARKLKDKVASKLLTTLLGEATPSGNEVTTDETVLAVISKFLKNAKQTLSLNPQNYDLQYEIVLLNSYLPESLSGKELRDKIADILYTNNIDSMRGMGVVMKELKTLPNTIDMAEAQKYIKELLA